MGVQSQKVSLRRETMIHFHGKIKSEPANEKMHTVKTQQRVQGDEEAFTKLWLKPVLHSSLSTSCPGTPSQRHPPGPLSRRRAHTQEDPEGGRPRGLLAGGHSRGSSPLLRPLPLPLQPRVNQPPHAGEVAASPPSCCWGGGQIKCR